jgi:hypothetical protein
VLLRSDTLQEMPQCLDGTKIVPIATNSYINSSISLLTSQIYAFSSSQYGQHHQYGVFNKLKISATSLQQGTFSVVVVVVVVVVVSLFFFTPHLIFRLIVLFEILAEEVLRYGFYSRS